MLSGVFATCLVISGAPSASADEDASALDLIQAAAPDVAEAALDPVSSDASQASYAADGGAVEISTTGSATTVTLSDSGDTRTVSLPTTDDAYALPAEDGVQVFQNSDDTKSAVAVADDFVSLMTIVESANAPESYTYDYNAYGTIQQAADGSVSIWDGDEEIGYFLTPWAVDASGAEVPTRYEVSGNTITQVVEHHGAGFSYPIVADPTYTYPRSNNIFSKIVEDRNPSNARVTLHVYLNPRLNIPAYRIPRSTLESKYNEIVPTAYRRQNMWDQLVCHAANAPGKSPWNLDAWRPNVGYAATVRAACNP